MGFSLEEIRGLYEDETHVPGIDALEEKIRLCEEELRLLKARKAQLQAMVTSQKKHRKMEKEGWTLASILGKVCKKVADLHRPIGHRRTLKCICLGKVCRV